MFNKLIIENKTAKSRDEEIKDYFHFPIDENEVSEKLRLTNNDEYDILYYDSNADDDIYFSFTEIPTSIEGWNELYRINKEIEDVLVDPFFIIFHKQISIYELHRIRNNFKIVYYTEEEKETLYEKLCADYGSQNVIDNLHGIFHVLEQ